MPGMSRDCLCGFARVPASITFVSVEKETSARGRLVGIARAVIVDQGCGYLHSCFGISLLVVVLWCVGNPDLWDRGLVCFWGTFLCGLFAPTYPLPGHRLVPESQYIHIYIFIFICIYMYI